MIEVEELHKQFGEIAAVRGLSFNAPDGAITGLLGANGAGKTTTLRMLCGMLKPQSGRVRIDGVSSAEDPLRAQRNVGALLDHAGLYPRLTARENLAYFGNLRGLSAPLLKERVEELLSLLGLTSIADRRTMGFSQGERMKTAIGRALIHSPRNLLLDEPTNGLDVPTVRSLRVFLKRMRDLGKCVIFSSHVLEEVRALCDSVVIVANGLCVAQGAPEELCLRTNTSSLEEAFISLTGARETAAC